MIFERKQYLDKIKHFLSDTNKILFLIWARQVGKTTLLKSLIEFWIIPANQVIFLSWDQFEEKFNTGEDFLSYLKIKFNFSEKTKYLIIDEFHFIENIGKILKNLIDEIRWWKYDFKIICSGSGSWNIFKGNTDSLIWRYDLVRIYPFSFWEFVTYKWFDYSKIDFENVLIVYKDLKKLFEEYLLFGWYPAVVVASSIEEKKYVLSNLLETYLYKDVWLLLKSGDFINFKKFLKLIASKLWSVYSVSNLASELWISRYVFEKYLFIVENTFLVYRLQPIRTGRVEWEISGKEKIYFNDIGFLRYILGLNEFVWELKGKVVENFVYNHLLLNLKNYQEIYYRRRRTGAEIDFVLYDNFEWKYVPVEVKAGKKDNIPKSLLSFLQKIDCKKWVVFYDSAKILIRNENERIVEFYPYFLTEKINLL